MRKSSGVACNRRISFDVKKSKVNGTVKIHYNWTTVLLTNGLFKRHTDCLTLSSGVDQQQSQTVIGRARRQYQYACLQLSENMTEGCAMCFSLPSPTLTYPIVCRCLTITHLLEHHRSFLSSGWRHCGLATPDRLLLSIHQTLITLSIRIHKSFSPYTLFQASSLTTAFMHYDSDRIFCSNRFQAASPARSAKMRPEVTDVARSVVCMSVCVCVMSTRVSCAETAEPIEMPLGGGLMRVQVTIY